jgi:hypothetical protein
MLTPSRRDILPHRVIEYGIGQQLLWLGSPVLEDLETSGIRRLKLVEPSRNL